MPVASGLRLGAGAGGWGLGLGEQPVTQRLEQLERATRHAPQDMRALHALHASWPSTGLTPAIVSTHPSRVRLVVAESVPVDHRAAATFMTSDALTRRRTTSGSAAVRAVVPRAAARNRAVPRWSPQSEASAHIVRAARCSLRCAARRVAASSWPGLPGNDSRNSSIHATWVPAGTSAVNACVTRHVRSPVGSITSSPPDGNPMTRLLVTARRSGSRCTTSRMFARRFCSGR